MINLRYVTQYLEQRAIENGVYVCRKYENESTAFVEWGKLMRLTNACFLEDCHIQYKFSIKHKKHIWQATWIFQDKWDFGYTTTLDYEIMRRTNWI